MYPASSWEWMHLLPQPRTKGLRVLLQHPPRPARSRVCAGSAVREVRRRQELLQRLRHRQVARLVLHMENKREAVVPRRVAVPVAPGNPAAAGRQAVGLLRTDCMGRPLPQWAGRMGYLRKGKEQQLL